MAKTNGTHRIYEAAKLNGRASLACAEILKQMKVDWDDETFVDSIALEFKVGYIAGYLKLDNREDAETVYNLPTADRGELNQRAYRTATVAWSQLRAQMGAPNAHNGEPRSEPKPRQVSAKQTAENRLEVIQDLSPKELMPAVLRVVPKPKTVADVGEFANWVCDAIKAFEQRNPKTNFGEYRGVFDNFISQVKLVGMAHKRAA